MTTSITSRFQSERRRIGVDELIERAIPAVLEEPLQREACFELAADLIVERMTKFKRFSCIDSSRELIQAFPFLDPLSRFVR